LISLFQVGKQLSIFDKNDIMPGDNCTLERYVCVDEHLQRKVRKRFLRKSYRIRINVSMWMYILFKGDENHKKGIVDVV